MPCSQIIGIWSQSKVEKTMMEGSIVRYNNVNNVLKVNK